MNIQQTNIDYACGQSNHKGYLAWDSDIQGPRPGIIVIHEWWGLNEYIRQRTEMLAELGYCALAIDMYGDGLIAETPDQAGAAMNKVLGDMETGTERLKGAYQALLSQSQVDPERTAAIGYCFGGAMALHMARIGMPLNAAVSFHGALGSFHTAKAGEIAANVLVCHGAGDAMVSMDDVENFKKEMDAAEANYQVVIHPGAPHGFTSKEADANGKKYEIPVGYDAAADVDSWNAMQDLFKRSF